MIQTVNKGLQKYDVKMCTEEEASRHESFIPVLH